jgi:hypothetical protein
MFIRKSQFKKYRDFWLGCARWQPMNLRVSADVYREKALAGENVADNIVTSIRMLKQAMVCERMLLEA